ncbi:hypothetical protein XELAEV_18018073mg [Xenopus laevis]|uniref:Uncharacterized protein n=1 Tax=Xenopus laevis TaxID=8355 RepID=A0A974DEP1_XENLA|nr:hypothetical protein XELAEV_18018073mg [Xenopus laevis]
MHDGTISDRLKVDLYCRHYGITFNGFFVFLSSHLACHTALLDCHKPNITGTQLPGKHLTNQHPQRKRW